MRSTYGSGHLGDGPFDELFARFFGAPGQRRPAYRVDIMRLLTEQARALVVTAASGR